MTAEAHVEQLRLSMLRCHELLDTADEPDFDRLARLAARICDAPMAVISLIDHQRQWFKSAFGLAVRETARSAAFCDHAIRGRDLFMVPDAAVDPRFAANPLVTGAPHLRFYAGMPLVCAGGHALGALAVLDRVPRTLSAMQVDALRTLADQVMAQITVRRLNLFKARQSAILERIAADAPLQDVLDAVARMIDSFDAQVMCAVSLPEADGGRLRLAAAPGLPDTFRDAIDGMPVGPRAASCGTAAYLRRPILVGDIDVDPLWRDYRATALQHGLRACWSYPVTSADGKLLGTLDIYAMRPGMPDAQQSEAIAGGCQLLRLAIERQQAMQALRENQERFRQQASLLDCTQDAVLTCTIDGEVMFWNRTAQRLLGWSAQEARGQRVTTLLYQDQSRYEAMLGRLLATGECSSELVLRRRSGAGLLVEARHSLVRDEHGRPHLVLVSFNDITGRKQAEQEIHQLAFYDQLTRLPNRRQMSDRLDQALQASARSQQRGALILIDLDNFKTLNDTLGHDKGDLLLMQVAARLMACVAGSDTVARLGGDEFVVVMEELGLDYREAAARAEGAALKIASILAYPYQIADYEYVSTPSIGVTVFGARTATADKILKEADLAMYRAKADGRNAVRLFNPQMQVALSARSALEADLRHALGRREFFLHYQPQMDRHGTMRGVEALLRWQHPEKGLIPPNDFIALAEDTGLINPLGQWVLHSACAQLAEWARQPGMAHLTMAVNVSAHQFRRKDFVEVVCRTIAQTGVDPALLKLEVTESMLLVDIEDTVDKMTAIKATGVSFALDDFGTGYSSLSYLRRLPLDQLKIDRSFIREGLAGASEAAIVRTIITLAHGLALEVIAEGVETEDQFGFLSEHDCDAYQGYLFSRPVPVEELRGLAAPHAEAAA